MRTFWFSVRNLQRVIRNILTLFQAVDEDLDEMESAINTLGTDLQTVDNKIVPIWTGTTGQWNALTRQQKAAYDHGIVNLTDDYADGRTYIGHYTVWQNMTDAEKAQFSVCMFDDL